MQWFYNIKLADMDTKYQLYSRCLLATYNWILDWCFFFIHDRLVVNYFKMRKVILLFQ